MEKVIANQNFDEERALYHLKDTVVEHCRFSGPADGESVLKEARNIKVKNCSFSLRYPLWHDEGFELIDSSMDELTRAPIWYASRGRMINCDIHGIKCLRECQDIDVAYSHIHSPEFGWKCRQIHVQDSEIESEYLFLDSSDVLVDNLKMKGKYSFQYMHHLEIKNSVLDTKDAFWHSTNVTVRDSIVKGEYLGWFSDGLTLINCRITGTQPLCYCKNLKLVNCIMEETDLAFEYSDVDADIDGNILSVKNPKSGIIRADSIGQIILEDSIMESQARIVTSKSGLQLKI